MKTCPNCQSTTFDDMEMCYDCMSTFAEPLAKPDIRENQAAARLKVVLTGYFAYELLLNKLEGRSLSVGSTSENAIVLPLEDVAEHQLEIFYSHGHIWVENTNPAIAVGVGQTPLLGTVCIQPGEEIKVGEARITVLPE